MPVKLQPEKAFSPIVDNLGGRERVPFNRTQPSKAPSPIFVTFEGTTTLPVNVSKL